jgi:protein MpaA
MLRFATAAFALVFCLPGVGAATEPMEQADWCKRISDRLASVSMASCELSALKSDGTLSHNGFPLLIREQPAVNPPKDENPVKILLLGGIHGDELTSVSVVFHWMEWLDTPEAQEFHWRIAPVTNPDGLFSPKPQRVNAKGVDLNRNFPTPGWEQDARSYWAKKTRKDPRRFPGAAPLSEPESRWLHEEMERFKPDVIISVHAPFGVLDFDGPNNPPRRFGRLYLSRVGVYPGSLGNYGGMHKNLPVITIELPNAMTMPPPAEVRRIWQDMLAWIGRSVSHGASVQRASAIPEAPEH